MPNYKGCDRLKPDFWVYPNFVWELKYDSLTLSPSYKVGVGVLDDERGLSVRFGRFVRERKDKRIHDACSVQEIIELKKKF